MRRSIITLFIILAVTCYAKADTLTVSSESLDLTQSLNLLSNPSNTVQIGYSFNVYHQWLCVDLRWRTAQTSNSETFNIENDSGIMNDTITILPSIDTGLRFQIIRYAHVQPYMFSLLNYTIISSSTSVQNQQANQNLLVIGLRTGIGTNFLLASNEPSFLLNMDMGYQYLSPIIPGVGNVNLSGVFLNFGFGYSF